MHKSQQENSLVEVDTCSFADLCDDVEAPLALDTYQRPYVWGDEKVMQLLSDLKEFQEQGPNAPDYYMGTVLLHADTNSDRRYIIDGQQRISSLCILHHVLTGALPIGQKLTYRSHISLQNLRRAFQLLNTKPPKLMPPPSIFERIQLTVITVKSEDLAFTFFDTQNNRGVPLHPTDLLKAYHLRAISGDCQEQLQLMCARRWERLQKLRPRFCADEDYAPQLFQRLLWRSRRWTGMTKKFIKEETFDNLLEEFQSRTIVESLSDTVTLYAAQHNRRAVALRLLPDSGYELQSLPLQISATTMMPFAIRQPISRGVGFFLYAENYARLSCQLLDNNTTQHPELLQFRELYTKVVSQTSVYLRELFVLASIVFVDRLGYGGLFEFGLRLDHVLGALRLSKHSIYRQAPVNLLKGEELGLECNLLDVVANAFRAEEVHYFLSSLPLVDEVYRTEQVERQGVLMRYKQALLSYFAKEGKSSLAEKPTWIAIKLKARG